MKFKFSIILLIAGQVTFAQTLSGTSINKTNYYDFFQTSGSIDWLRSSDAIPIIINELEKKGIPYYKIGVGDLIKINDTTHLVVSVSFAQHDNIYGFIYEAEHEIPLNRTDRKFLKEKTQRFVQSEQNKNDWNYMEVNPLPTNIFLLKETCYWYQFDDNGGKYNVSRPVIEKILRQDIDDYLNRFESSDASEAKPSH